MGRTSRRIGWFLTFALTLMVTLNAMPGTAWAETSETLPSINLRNKNGNGLTVEGGALGTDYTYADSVLTILTDKPLTISGATTTDRIVIAENVQAKVTLSSVTIDITEEQSAIDLWDGASLSLKLAGESTLRPGGGHAGIHVPSGTFLTIGGWGSLAVDGGRADSATAGGAGIGANPSGDLGSITISGGTVVARSTNAGSAGIGAGGWSGGTTDSSVTISGGRVTASAAAGGEGSIAAATVSVSDAIVDMPNNTLDLKGVRMDNCIVFANGAGEIHPPADGDTYVLSADLTVPAGSSLTVGVGQTLFIAGGVTLTNEGTIWNSGSIAGDGSIKNDGTVYNLGEGWIRDGLLQGMPAQELEGAEYVDEGGQTQVAPTYTVLTSSMTSLNGGWYLATDEVTIGSRVTVNGSVNLILADGAKLTVNGGITVLSGNSLTIYGQTGGTGELISTAGERWQAGIGNVEKTGAAGAITINGGAITATGGARGAGIGCTGRQSCGTIAVNGGSVTARGGSYCAGIGGGYMNEGGGTITITDGVVYAEGGNGAYGIGDGSNGWSVTVTITGGTVTAKGDNGKNGIGHSFSTGADGDAVIFADDIFDQSGKNDGSWSGVIFEGESGGVYAPGGALSVPQDWKIPSGHTLAVPEGVTLEVAGSMTWDDAKIENRGIIKVAEGGSIDPAVANVSVADVTAAEGETATFEVAVSSTGAGETTGTAYRWQTLGEKGEWADVPGATGPTLELANVSMSQSGAQYRCVVTLGGCTTYSAPATLMVTERVSEPEPEPETPVTPPTCPTYEPEVPEADGGTVEILPSRPHSGDEVTVTPVPEEGKEVADVIVTDEGGEPVEVTDNGDGTWTFVQPAGSVTILVTFGCDGGELCPSRGYADVDQGAWYHGAVDWAVSSGAILGYGDGTFGPDSTLTRAEMATILCRLAGEPAADAGALPNDCSQDGWYANGVAWALVEGVFHGYGDGTFGPGDAISREQAACVLYNRAAAAGEDVSARADLSGFADASELSAWARDAMSWAVAEGVFHGTGQGTLDPARALTRAEGAAVLWNLETRAE